MKQKNFKALLLSLIILTAIFLGGCRTDNNNELTSPDTNTVSPPSSFTFNVDAVAGGDASVTFNWTASPDANKSNFKGYRIITAEVDSNGNITSVLQEASRIKNLTYSIDPLDRGRRYKTFLCSELEDGTLSDTLKTEIYAAVFYNIDGVIDSYVQNSSTMSGFGWNISTGAGTSYSYTQGNASLIDFHMEETRNAPYFYSPKVFGDSFKLTRMKLIGSGQSGFDETNLPDADETILLAENDNVYLLKTQENYYIKIWIKSVEPPGLNHDHFTIHFDYKVQPIKGLRVL
jgi:hypothetical protein